MHSNLNIIGSVIMTESTNNIRLAVDTGEAALGLNSVIGSIKNNTAKLIILAKVNDNDILEDIQHMAKVAEISVQLFEGNSMDLGSLCGKPFSVSALSIINPGASDILKGLEKKSDK